VVDMNPRTRRCLALLNVFAAFALGACTIAPAPPPAYGPPPGAAAPPPAASPAAPAQARYEDNTYRPGGDLRSFKMSSGGPEACAAECEKDPGCYAYNYTKPEQAHHGVAECALKHNIPMASKSACCVSGVIRPWP
jgi:hypothetical protein